MLIETQAERNIWTDPPNVIAIAAATATLILPSVQGTAGDYSQRLIQNVGNNPCYYSENLVDNTTIPPTPYCDSSNNFHGLLTAGQQLDCSGHRQAVCVYSPLGTTISTTVRRRNQ